MTTFSGEDEIDDAIYTLNRNDRRGSNCSNDSLNFRDSSFDPMAKTRKKNDKL